MSRMNSRIRKKFYPLLVARDSEECALCGVIGNRSSLIIDHKDNDNSNNTIENYQLLCRSCNGKKNPRGKAKKQSTMREKEIDYLKTKESSAELAKSEKCKPMFKKWLKEVIKQYGTLGVPELVNAGAEKINLSQQTTMRYLQGSCSFEGDYEIYTIDEKKYVRFKAEYAAKMKNIQNLPTDEEVNPVQN